MTVKKPGAKTGRPPGSKSAPLEFLQFNPEARRQYEAFRASKGKPPAFIPPAPPTMAGIPTEGVLPTTGTAATPGVPPVLGAPAVDAFDPKGCAESLAGLSALVCNFFLWKNKRELLNEMEVETYAKEITPFVTKYQRWFQYMVEVRAIAATGALIVAVAQKPADVKRIEREAKEKAETELAERLKKEKEGKKDGQENP